MNCEKRAYDLLLYAHHEAGPIDRWRIRQHLNRCPFCREEYAQLRSESVTLRHALRPVRNGQEAIVAGALARIRGTPSPAGARRGLYMRLRYGVALILALLAVAAAAASYRWAFYSPVCPGPSVSSVAVADPTINPNMPSNCADGDAPAGNLPQVQPSPVPPAPAPPTAPG